MVTSAFPPEPPHTLRYDSSMRFQFGDFELDRDRFALLRRGSAVSIEPRVLDLLIYLVRHRERVVSKEELLQNLWSDRVVSDGSLSVAIFGLREALSDPFSRQQIIRTVRSRGYQFVAPVLTTEPALYATADSLADAMIGREHEILAIRRSLSRCLEQRRSTVTLISGTPGIGKTRLLDEACSIAIQMGIKPLVGRCLERDDAPPLWPWIQIHRLLLREFGQTQLRHWSGGRLDDLAAIAQQPDDHRTSPSPHTRDLDRDRFRLFDTLSLLFSNILARSPLLIAIDDLHRADQPSAQLFAFLSRELHFSCATFLGAFRTSPPVNSELAELKNQPGVQRLDLKPLSRQETDLLLAQVLDLNVAPETRDLLFHKTAGNPLFLRQLAPLLASSRKIDTEHLLSGDIRYAVAEHVRALSLDARIALEAASVVGPEFALSVLDDLTTLDSAALSDALSEAVRAGVLVADDSSGESFRFTHALVRDALYANQPAEIRIRTHLAVAQAAKKAHAGQSEHAAEIAHHFYHARQHDDALSFAIQAGDHASRTFSYPEAASHYHRALLLLSRLRPDSIAERCKLLLALGTQQLRAGQREDAQSSLLAAARLARSLGLSTLLADAALAIAPGLLSAEARSSDILLLELLREALESLGSSSPDLSAMIAARLAMAVHWSDESERRVDLIRQAESSLARATTHLPELQVLYARWFCEWTSGAPAHRAALANELFQKAQLHRDVEMSLLGRLLRLVELSERGEMAAFDLEAAHFSGLANSLRQPQSLWYSPMLAGMRALSDVRLDEAGALIRQTREVSARVQDANALHCVTVQSLLLAFEKDELTSVVPGLREGSATFPDVPAWRAGLAWALCHSGQHEEAAREFEILAYRDFVGVPQRYDWTAAVAFLAEVCWYLRDERRASVLYDALIPLRDRFAVVGLSVASFGSIERLLGLLADVLQLPVVDEHFENAASRNRAAGALGWCAHSWFAHALSLERRSGGQCSRAQLLRQKAVVTATDLGMKGLIRRLGSA